MKANELIDKLNSGALTVEFTKVDGSHRVMKCTRAMAIIPEEHHPKTTQTSESSIRVFDLEAQGWRSFIYENVTNIYE
jgi:hypothetical protein